MPGHDNRPTTLARRRQAAPVPPGAPLVKEVALTDISLDDPLGRTQPADLTTLMASLAQHQMLQPPVVRPTQDGTYAVVLGRARVAAAVRLGWETIAVIVVQCDATEATAMAASEGLSWRRLSALQQAALFAALRDDGWSEAQIGERVGSSQATVSKRLRLLDDADLRDPVLAGRAPVSTLEELLPLDADQRAQLLPVVIAEQWGREKVRQHVRAVQATRSLATPPRQLPSRTTARPRLAAVIGATVAWLRGQLMRPFRRQTATGVIAC